MKSIEPAINAWSDHERPNTSRPVEHREADREAEQREQQARQDEEGVRLVDEHQPQVSPAVAHG